MVMKVTMTVLMIVALALVAGVAFAAYEGSEMSPMSTEKVETPLYNGITVFDLGPAPDCAHVYGAGAGGEIPAVEPAENGITSFELAVPGSLPTGLCAGKIGEEKAWINNGITVFE